MMLPRTFAVWRDALRALAQADSGLVGGMHDAVARARGGGVRSVSVGAVLHTGPRIPTCQEGSRARRRPAGITRRTREEGDAQYIGVRRQDLSGGGRREGARARRRLKRRASARPVRLVEPHVMTDRLERHAHHLLDRVVDAHVVDHRHLVHGGLGEDVLLDTADVRKPSSYRSRGRVPPVSQSRTEKC